MILGPFRFTILAVADVQTAAPVLAALSAASAHLHPETDALLRLMRSVGGRRSVRGWAGLAGMRQTTAEGHLKELLITERVACLDGLWGLV